MATLAQDSTMRARLRRLESSLGNRLATLCDSRLGFACSVFFASVLAACTEFLVHEFLEQIAAPEIFHALLDAALMGLATSVIASFLLLAIRERHRRMLQEVQRVAELNHTVRNALQVIVHSQYLPQSEQDAGTILESVQRIDDTLRDLFPSIPRDAAQQPKKSNVA
jgi:two-component sensor histidine kinase